MLRLPTRAKGSVSKRTGLHWKCALTPLRNPRYPHQRQRRDDKVPLARTDCSSARFPRLEGRKTDGSRGQGMSYTSPRALGKERARHDWRVSMGFGPPTRENPSLRLFTDQDAFAVKCEGGMRGDLQRQSLVDWRWRRRSGRSWRRSSHSGSDIALLASC